MKQCWGKSDGETVWWNSGCGIVEQGNSDGGTV